MGLSKLQIKRKNLILQRKLKEDLDKAKKKKT